MMSDGHFWEAFNLSQCPCFTGKSVLEIGSGEGSRCIEVAINGAERVVGVEPFSESVATGLAKLKKCPEDIVERIEFFEGYLASLPSEQFDVIISENTFEHVLDVPNLMTEIVNRLKPGGRFYLGFGPLYHAPDGDHNWLRSALPGGRIFLIPWGHLVFKRAALRRLSRIYGKPITQTHDWPYLSLNQHTLDEFKTIFKKSGLRISYFRTNYVKSFRAGALRALGQLPGLSRYCTLNLSVILEKGKVSVPDIAARGALNEAFDPNAHVVNTRPSPRPRV